MRPALLALLLAGLALAACGGSEQARPPAPAAAAPMSAGLERAALAALRANHRLSVQVLWDNALPPAAARSTRGPALAALRAAAGARRRRGIRVRLLAGRYEILALRLDPSYLRASATVRDRQRLQLYGPGERPLSPPRILVERARVELRRLGRAPRFVVWQVVLLP